MIHVQYKILVSMPVIFILKIYHFMFVRCKQLRGTLSFRAMYCEPG